MSFHEWEELQNPGNTGERISRQSCCILRVKIHIEILIHMSLCAE